MASFLNNKKVYLTIGDNCFSYKTVNNTVIRTVEENFECHHEEADTRIIYHLSKLENNSIVMSKVS